MKRACLLMMVAAVGLMAVPEYTNMSPDTEIDHGQALPYLGNRASPGVEVGITDYDFQNNGSIGRYVAISPIGGFHFYWTYSYDSTAANRRAYYNYYYPPDYWLGALGMDTDQSRMGALDMMADGRALGSAHASVTGGYACRVYLDAAEGAGAFQVIDLPDGGSTTCPIWPKQVVDMNDDIYVVATVNGGTHSFWTKSTDEGATWLPWDSTLAGVPLNLSTYYLQAGREFWATSHNTTWTMLANSTGDLTSKVCWETDGTNWYFDTIWTSTATDSVFPWFWTSVVYDNNAYAHVVFDVQDTAATGGGAQQSGWRAQIWHWNQQTDQISVVDNGMGWFFTNPGPGYNHGTVSEPQLTIDRATGDLYCTWCYADAADVAANGYINNEIWGARSTDNGATWIEHHNITNSPTPGATTGNCDNDWYQTLAEETLGDTLVMFYMNDKEAGHAAYGDGTAYTDNPYLFYLYEWSPGAVAEHTVTTPMKLALNIRPNPSVQNTQISYSMSKAGSVSLKLYSVDGRLVETVYSGSRDAGVYVESIDARQFSSGTYFVILDVAGEQVTQSLVVVR